MKRNEVERKKNRKSSLKKLNKSNYYTIDLLKVHMYIENRGLFPQLILLTVRKRVLYIFTIFLKAC